MRALGLIGLMGLMGLIGLMVLIGPIGHIGPIPFTVYYLFLWGLGCFYILALPYTFPLLYLPVLKILFCLFLLVLEALRGLGE